MFHQESSAVVVDPSLSPSSSATNNINAAAVTAGTGASTRSFVSLSTNSQNEPKSVKLNDQDSKLRPLKVGNASSSSNLTFNQQSEEEQSSPQIIVHPSVRKSDSLDSSRAACCTRLAFNIYNKALESAKKALPRTKSAKDRHQFPRSFGEDFGSIGPDGFNYFDDSQTECSGDYRDIDFNRDSYYFGGQEVLSIPELPESEEIDHTVKKADYNNNQPPSPPPIDIQKRNVMELGSDNNDPHPNSPRYFPKDENLDEFFKENIEPRSTSLEDFSPDSPLPPTPDDDKQKKSFMNRIFRKRDLSAEKKGKKSTSPERAVENPDDDAVLSIVSRQSPINLVYGKPPDIYVQECTTLPRTADEIAQRTSQIILTDVFNTMLTNDPEQSQDVANQDNVQQDSKQQKSPKKFLKNFKFTTTVRDDSRSPSTERETSVDLQDPDSKEVSTGKKGFNFKKPNFKFVFKGGDKEASAEREDASPEPQEPFPDFNPDTDGELVAPDAKKKFHFKKPNFKFGSKSGERIPSNEPEIGVDPDDSIVDPDVPLEMPAGKSKFHFKKPHFKFGLKSGDHAPSSERDSSVDPNEPSNPDAKQESVSSGKNKFHFKKPNFKFGSKSGGDDKPPSAERTSSVEPMEKDTQSQSSAGKLKFRFTKPSFKFGTKGDKSPQSSERATSLEPYADIRIENDSQPQSSTDKGKFQFKKPSFKFGSKRAGSESKVPSTERSTSLEPIPPYGIIKVDSDAQSQSSSSTIDRNRASFKLKDKFKKMKSSASDSKHQVGEFFNKKFNKQPEVEPMIYCTGGINAHHPHHHSIKLPTLSESRSSTLTGTNDMAIEIPIGIAISPVSTPVSENVAQPLASVLVDTPSSPSALSYHSVGPFDQQPELGVPKFEQIENIKEIGVTFEPTPMDYESEPDESENMKSKLKNMVGSFKHKVSNLIKKDHTTTTTNQDDEEDEQQQQQWQAAASQPAPPRPPPPHQYSKVQPIENQQIEVMVENIFKETNLDEDENGMMNYDDSAQQTPLGGGTSGGEESTKFRFNVDSPIVQYDADDDAPFEDDESYTGDKMARKKIKRKKVPQTPNENNINDGDEKSWSSKNKQRFQRFRTRAAESFNQFADKIKKRKDAKNANRRDLNQKQYRPDVYEYDFNIASDSELSPGTGVDSLRRSKMYQELAEAQERLDLYMSPVSGPLRPPRAKRSNAYDDGYYNQSMPSLSASRRNPPPRPPPPKITSSFSIPAIITEDEMSLSTSMCSLWTRASRRGRGRGPTRQRVPAAIFYRNVRFGYRPKKSYVEQLQKSQNLYSLAAKSHSMSHLPSPPSRKSKTFYIKRGTRATTSPPPPNSRASLVSNSCYEPVCSAKRIPFKELNFAKSEAGDDNDYDVARSYRNYDLYGERSRGDTVEPIDPLNWEPFKWKVKRCRSLTEVDVREGQNKQPRCSAERQLSQSPEPALVTDAIISCQRTQTSQMTAPPSHQHRTRPSNYPQRLFNWLASSASLDKLHRSHSHPQSPNKSALNLAPSHYSNRVPCKPPRPPQPRAARASRSGCSTPTSLQQSLALFPYSSPYNASSNATKLTNYNPILPGSVSSQSGRPLPPPPVPPRPKLIPAHYARKSPAVEKRECGVDTSENGFLAFHCREKEVQVKPSLGGALVSRDTSLDLDELNDTLNSVCNSLADFTSKNTPVPADEEEEEVTIVEEPKTTNATDVQPSALSTEDDIRDEPATITSNTVYMDAQSKLSDQVTPVLPGSGKAGEWSDDDTINDNDDLSSLSSNYQSICSNSIPAQTSWVHQEQQRRESISEQSKQQSPVINLVQPNSISTATSASDDYETAAENNSLSNRTSITSEDLNSFEQFQQQFTHVNLENNQNSDITIEDVADNDNNNQSDAQLSNNKSSNRQSLISTESTASDISTASSSESSASSSIQSSPQSTVSDADTILAKEAAAMVTANGAEETLSDSSTIVNSIPENSQLRENISKLPTITPKGFKADKLYYTVHEVYSTERDYVDILRMLTGEFRAAIVDHVSKEFIEEFFRPLNIVLPINERFLFELTNRVLRDWDDNPKISDLIIDFCPYFKEYSIYIRQFDRLRQMLSETRDQNSSFNEALCTFERSSRCSKLPITAFLLKPIQRLPQYPMMLKNYIRVVKPDSEEYANTEKAIKIVSDVVEHLDNVRELQKTAMALNELWSRIFFAKITYHPYKSGRELLKYGHLQKVSRKEFQERFFILFNDSLLYLIPVMNDSHKLKEVLPLAGMRLQLPTQPDIDNEFSVISVKRSFALLAKSIKERNEWVDALKNAISEYESNQESFKTASLAKSQSSIQIGSNAVSSPSHITKQSSLSLATSFRTTSEIVLFDNRSDNLELLGERAPVWVHDRRVTMCQLCLKSFNFIVRRHHCRACGYVVCGDCSAKERILKYLCENEKNTPVRVCDLCDEKLTQSEQINLNNNCHNNGTGFESDVESIASYDNEVNISTGSGTSTPNKANTSNESQCGSPIIQLDISSLDRVNIVRNSYRLKKHISSVLVEVPANDKQVLISGYLLRLTQPKRSWKRYWFLIKHKVLYTYREREDVAALESLPLLGYNVSSSEVSIKNYPAELTIRLSHPGQATVYFFTENPEIYTRWMNAFRKCINLY